MIAEKADTMMFLGDANTRDRDYGDIYLLSQIHTVEAETLRRALQSVAEHRGHEVRPLGPLLETLRESRQQPGRRSAPAPACRVCQSPLPTSSMQWSTSLTGCRIRAAQPGILKLDSGSRRRPVDSQFRPAKIAAVQGNDCASLLFEAGRDVKQVSEWLGHADAGFTLKVYVHLMDAGVGDAAFMDQAVVPAAPVR